MTARATIRTRNAEDKKRRILAAAKPLFAAKGYTRTSVKAVADGAGVAASLVLRHFGSKQGLFRAALTDAVTRSTFDGSAHEGFGERVVAEIVGGPGRVVSPSMIALSLDDEEARRTAAEVALRHVLDPTAAWLGGAAPFERAMHVMILSLGLSLFRRLFDDHMAFAPGSDPARAIARAIQAETTPEEGGVAA